MADAQSMVLGASGLSTSSNEFGTPASSLQEASNIVLLAAGLVSCRKGLPPKSYVPAGIPKAMAFFGDTGVWQVGTNTLQRDTGTAFVSYTTPAGGAATFTPPDADLLRMKFMEMTENLFFTTTEGVKRLDQVAGAPVSAGVVAAADIKAFAYVLDATNFLAGGASVGYRVVYGTKDAHGRLIFGAPSGRQVATNPNAPDVAAFGAITIAAGPGAVGAIIAGTTVTVTWGTSDAVTAAALAVAINANTTLGPLFVAVAVSATVTVTSRTPGTAGNSTTLVAQGTGTTVSGATFSGGTGSEEVNVEISFPIPGTLTTSDFWQLYRTRQTVPEETGVTLDPGDEEFLCQEAYFTTAQIAANEVAITDTQPDDLLGVPLYTNAISGEGILQANATPPLAKDITSWNGAAWFANTAQRGQVTLQIIGTGSGEAGYTGVRLGDTISFLSYASAVFVASTAISVAGPLTFQVFSTSDAGYNIEQTARSLVSLINMTGDTTGLRANYVSPTDGTSLGQILVEASALDGAEFNATTTTERVPSAIGGLVRAANVTTVTTLGSHNLETDDVIYLRPRATADANFPSGNFTITRLSPSTFSYPQVLGNAVSAQPYDSNRISPAPALAWNPPPPPDVFSIAVGGLVRTLTTTVTVTVASATTLLPGQKIVIEPAAGVADPNFAAGTKTVVTVAANALSWTYAESGSNVSSTVAYQSGARVTSDPYRGIAGPSYLSYSKPSQPDSVPESNWLQIGRTDTPILRFVGEGQNGYAFKNEGVYIVTYTGGDIPYRVDPLDSTVHLYAPDSVVSVAGRVFAVTNQGVVAGTSAGFKILSGQIEQQLFQYFGPTLAALRVDSFAVSHETDRQYILGVPALSGATTAPYNAPLLFVYSVYGEGGWTIWPKSFTCGAVRVSDDSLQLGGATAYVYAQRNTKTAQDFADAVSLSGLVPWDSATRTLTFGSIGSTAAGDGVVIATATAFVSNVVINAANDDIAFNLANPVIGGYESFTGTVANATYSAPATLAAAIRTTILAAMSSSADFAGVTVSVVINGGGYAGIAFGGTCTPATAVALDFQTNASTQALGTLLGYGGIQNSGTVNAAGSAFINAPVVMPAGVSATPGATAAVVTATTATTLTLSGDPGVVVDGLTPSVYIYDAIPCDLGWRTLLTKNAANEKQWQELDAHFRERAFYKAAFGFETETYPDGATVEFYPAQQQDGTVPAYTGNANLYPGMPVRPKLTIIRSLPQDVERGAYLAVSFAIREAFAVWSLNAVGVQFTDTGNRPGGT